MSTQITIHGKRTETVYAFTIEYKGETITGRYITVDGEDEDEPLGLLEDEERLEFDKNQLVRSQKESLVKPIGKAIEDYEKIRT